jgi:hypothetical protein
MLRSVCSSVVRRNKMTPKGPLMWDGQQYPHVTSSDTGPYRWPQMIVGSYDPHTFDPMADIEDHTQIPRDGFGVPAHIPPEIALQIKHTFQVPPIYFPWIKKLGEDTAELKPYCDKLIKGELTFEEYEDMFYSFAKPLKVHRSEIPQPYRTAEEVKLEDFGKWNAAWEAYRQRLRGDLHTKYYLRNLALGGIFGLFVASIYVAKHKQHRVDMKLFYLQAPEHKINWVKPRGDL